MKNLLIFFTLIFCLSCGVGQRNRLAMVSNQVVEIRQMNQFLNESMIIPCDSNYVKRLDSLLSETPELGEIIAELIDYAGGYSNEANEILMSSGRLDYYYVIDPMNSVKVREYLFEDNPYRPRAIDDIREVVERHSDAYKINLEERIKTRFHIKSEHEKIFDEIFQEATLEESLFLISAISYEIQFQKLQLLIIKVANCTSTE